MSSRFVLPFADVGSGIQPSSGAKLFFFETGTSTPKNTFSDQLSTPTVNSNPVIADSTGVFGDIFITGKYKVQLKDKNDSQIWEADPIDEFAIVADNSFVKNFLSLASALSDGGIIENDAINLKEHTTGSGGSAMWDVISGTGTANGTWRVAHDTLSLTLVLRLDGVMNFPQIGAIGDGATDDTAAFTAAAATGFDFEGVNGDVYLITSKVTFAGVKIEGNDATIKNTIHFIVIEINGSDTTFNGFKFIGPNDSLFTAGSIAINVTGSSNPAAAPTYIDTIDVSNNDIIGYGQYGIFFSFTRNGKANNNTVNNIGFGAICGVSSEDIRVNGNFIQGVSPGSPDDAYGSFFDRNESKDETEHPRSFRINISNNIIRDVFATAGNGQGINTHGGVDFVIDSNIIGNTQKGIFITSSKIAGILQLAAIRVTVSNNVISIPNVGVGIIFAGAIDGVTVNEYAKGCVASGNIIKGGGTSGTATSGALTLQATRDVVVTGNTISEPSPNGIYINFENINMNITGNSIKDPFDASVSLAACIYVDGNNNAGLISNNSFGFENAALGTFVAVNSVRVDASTGLDLDFGRSHFDGIDATHLTFLNLASSGVRFDGLHAESGRATITLNNGGTLGVEDVFFDKRFPYVPKVRVTPVFPIDGGITIPVVAAGTGVGLTTLKVTTYAYPADGGTWGAQSTLDVYWEAT